MLSLGFIFNPVAECAPSRSMDLGPRLCFHVSHMASECEFQPFRLQADGGIQPGVDGAVLGS